MQDNSKAPSQMKCGHAVCQELVKKETKTDGKKKDRNASYLHIMQSSRGMQTTSD